MGTREGEQVTVTSDKDHPHACGDKTVLSKVIGVLLGSSPRVWGQELPAAKKLPDEGIIPTRVGTSQIVNRRDV